MDTGVGNNAIDKFTRHVGWSHPGGPKVEEAAKGASISISPTSSREWTSPFRES